ncbi:hypothetical protein [Streptomyces virginiae]
MPDYVMAKYATNKLIKRHLDGVFTFGATQPVLTVLDVNGFQLADLFLIGLNDDCGTLVLPTESRAGNAAAALEPAYATKVVPFGRRGEDWAVEYSRRNLDGSEPDRVLTNIVLRPTD